MEGGVERGWWRAGSSEVGGGRGRERLDPGVEAGRAIYRQPRTSIAQAMSTTHMPPDLQRVLAGSLFAGHKLQTLDGEDLDVWHYSDYNAHLRRGPLRSELVVPTELSAYPLVSRSFHAAFAQWKHMEVWRATVGLVHV